MPDITITIDNKEILATLQKAIKAGANLQPVMQEIGEIMLLSTKLNFEQQGRPTPWKKSRRVERGGGQTLSDKGRLRNSFTCDATADKVTIGTNVEYAPHLQFGTKPRIIRPNKAKALNIPGIGFRKKVNHPGMPARPFLLVQDNDVKKIIHVIESHLTGGL
jgi:phage virion morphogenesis protein